MRDIHELIRQRETEVDRFQKEIERIRKELDALRLTAKLLDDANATRTEAAAVPAAVQEIATYGVPAVTKAPAPASQTPSTWASAKQFP